MNLAIVSPNKNAYSETFIHNHVKCLPANVHFLFDGHLPKKYSTDQGLTEHELGHDIAHYLTENHIDLVLCEYGPTGVAMLPAAKQANIPLAVHFHGYDAYRNDVLDFYRTGYRTLFEHAKAVISVSQHMCGQLEKLGCASSNIHYLPYGIDTAIFRVHEHATRLYTFAACGRFVEKKAPALTIKAFADVIKKLPDATMVMIGDGELLVTCRELASALGVGTAIHFTGALPQGQIAELYSRSRIFVQHSVTARNGDSEGTPLAILESAACGLPAVSTRHGGIADVIRDGETGFLVNENDTSAMTGKMLALAQQPELANSMGLKASAMAHSQYDLNSYTQKLWKVLQQNAAKDR